MSETMENVYKMILVKDVIEIINKQKSFITAKPLETLSINIEVIDKNELIKNILDGV